MRKYRFHLLVAAVALIAVIAAGLFLNRAEADAATQRTDDAYVRADMTVVAPQVSGVIVEVAVQDHQAVEAGAPLFRLDDREQQIAVANAEATVASLRAQLDRQQSVIAQAQTAVAATRASLELAERNYQRFTNLARDGSGTVQARQQAEAERAIQRAAHARDQAGVRAAGQQVAILQAELEKAQAAQADAELRLAHTRVSAPVAGIVAQRRARVGGYAQAGEPQLTLVPLDDVYIEANFRETQMARVQVGQPVEVTVDALPGVRLQGHVDSLGPSTGAAFSPVPPHNATGNFTRIVQRLPVRIRLDDGQEDVARLRVGMSVRPVIRTGVAGVDREGR